MQAGDSPPAAARVRVIGDDVDFGIVSDIDDTTLSTYLPRPLLAAYNTFVAREEARRPVRGMADLYGRLLAGRPDAPTVYVSTGAWNTAPTLRRFLSRNGFPDGPMLLTDWGPTNTGWFRSGREHKRECLESLVADFPRISWVLVGDDGQHDPGIYADFAACPPRAGPGDRDPRAADDRAGAGARHARCTGQVGRPTAGGARGARRRRRRDRGAVAEAPLIRSGRLRACAFTSAPTMPASS